MFKRSHLHKRGLSLLRDSVPLSLALGLRHLLVLGVGLVAGLHAGGLAGGAGGRLGALGLGLAVVIAANHLKNGNTERLIFFLDLLKEWNPVYGLTETA